MAGDTGETLSISARLQRLVHADIEAPPMKLDPALVPLQITAMLTMHQLTWDDLGGNLQQLLLWDAGYVLTGDSSLAKVYTRCGMTMDDIIISRNEYAALGCGIVDCGRTYRAGDCLDNALEQAVKCATDGVDAVANDTVWAEERSNTDVLHLQIYRHSLQLFAIHTAHADAPTRSGAGSMSCPMEPSLIIPCTTYVTDGDWRSPQSTRVLSELLVRFSGKEGSAVESTPVSLWIFVILLAVLTLLLAVLLTRKLRAQRGFRASHRASIMPEKPSLAMLEEARGSLADYSSHSLYMQSSPDSEVLMQSVSSIGLDSIGSPIAVRQRDAYSDAIGTSETMMAFQSNDLILHKRVPTMDLVYTSVIFRGATCEAHLGHLHGKKVALKKLVLARKNNPVDIEGFAREIQLSAILVHPSIVRVVGVAWSSFQNIVMALEYKDGGDLQSVLMRNVAAQWTWENQKVCVAAGIAKALAYLHSREMPVLHRDVRSGNVLLNGSSLEPALCDFGSACRWDRDESENIAVSTVSSAPEVVMSKPYTCKADIYSLGVVLVELDTCEPLHRRHAGGDHSAASPTKTTHGTASNPITSHLRADCPAFIRQVAPSCLNDDPRQRPTAKDVVRQLSQWMQSNSGKRNEPVVN